MSNISSEVLLVFVNRWRNRRVYVMDSSYDNGFMAGLEACADELEAEVTVAMSQVECPTCEPEGIFATDGTGPFDCYSCGKKASPGCAKCTQAVAEIALSDDGYKIGLLGPLRAHRLPLGTKLYAHPPLPQDTEWRKAVEDAVVMTECGPDDWNDPRKMVDHAIDWHVGVERDPAVSQLALDAARYRELRRDPSMLLHLSNKEFDDAIDARLRKEKR